MLNGYNLAESGWHSIPTFKSRSVVLGDPIYNPMKQKAIATDSSLSRELVAFDEAVQGLAGQERKISVYLAEGPEPEMADFRLEYGATQAMASNIDYNYYYGSKREFILKGLSAATTYYYRITAKDPAGNTKASSMREFTTAQSDSEGIFSLNLLQDKTLIEPGQGISFTSSSNCQDCTYTWQFGDCSQASGTGQMHHYSEEGVYDVFLVAKNSKGISKSARGIVFAYLGQACETGETQECQKQQGVCAGSQQQCAAGSWPGCSDANYSQYSQDYEPAETTKCSDAKDNDCDGLSDCTDPDCASNQDCASACSDGTAILECSTNKPLYCSEDRLLVNDCNRCDCPSGLECNSQNSLCEVECVTMTVLMGYIGQWKTGNLNMATLMQKINKWKTGEGC